MSNWTEELDRMWAALINHALLFSCAAIIIGGQASVMEWSDHHYSDNNN